MMLPNKQWIKDALWRSCRTFAQTLAGMLVAVQASSVIPSTETISIPWQAYLYASFIAALVSFLQSFDRERAVTSVTEPIPEPARLTAAEAQLAAFGPGCGGDQR